MFWAFFKVSSYASIELNASFSIWKLVLDNTNNNDKGTLTELIFSNLGRLSNGGDYTLLEGYNFAHCLLEAPAALQPRQQHGSLETLILQNDTNQVSEKIED